MRLWHFGSLAVLSVIGLILLAGSPVAAVVTFGQLDDFQDGTTMGWIEGAISPNPPTNIPNGGPNGAGDRYLQDSSSGGFGAGSKMIFFNQSQWTGDFNSAGVTRLNAMMTNLGSTTLHMRVAIQGGMSGSIYGSTTAVVLAPMTTWTPVTFNLTSSEMTLIGGTESLSDVLQGVFDFRLLSAQFGPSFQGDTIAATLGVDNIRALRLPGDANFDGTVNLTDFNVLAGNFGISSGATWGQGDFNFDGMVNLSDFNFLAANFGLSAGPDGPSAQDWASLAAAVVPEPSMTLLLSAVAASAAMSYRRRR